MTHMSARHLSRSECRRTLRRKRSRQRIVMAIWKLFFKFWAINTLMFQQKVRNFPENSIFLRKTKVSKNINLGICFHNYIKNYHFISYHTKIFTQNLTCLGLEISVKFTGDISSVESYEITFLRNVYIEMHSRTVGTNLHYSSNTHVKEHIKTHLREIHSDRIISKSNSHRIWVIFLIFFLFSSKISNIDSDSCRFWPVPEWSNVRYDRCRFDVRSDRWQVSEDALASRKSKFMDVSYELRLRVKRGLLSKDIEMSIPVHIDIK